MKTLRFLVLLMVLGYFGLQFAGTVRDRGLLNRELVRLHVVGASDSKEDQSIKLKVRDGVLKAVSGLGTPATAEEAGKLLEESLPQIQTAAQAVLRELGCEDSVTVSLCREVFPTREYDSFTLPAGVYKALRVTVGEGAGRNWWCVLFPKLCIPAVSVEAEAAGAGFSEELTETVTQPQNHRVSFWLLELLGRGEGLLFRLGR